MKYMKLTKEKLDESFDWESLSNDKVNRKVKLSPYDKKRHAKVLCNEPYAQDLYDKMIMMEKNGEISTVSSKDFKIGDVLTVRAITINFNDSYITTLDENTKTPVIVKFKDYADDIADLVKGHNIVFKVKIIKATLNGEYYGSHREYAGELSRLELFDHYNNNTWFEVKIDSLIDGGYLAKYKNNVTCFIPGSHAGANVIMDFNKLIGKTINVMVDSYDQQNKMFIVSYKKYIKHSINSKIHDLSFSKEYTGVLTSKPYKFGMFVEFEDYYTGLIHSSEFDNYEEVMKKYKAGDRVNFYIKDILMKKNKHTGNIEPRIMLTFDKESINPKKSKWQSLKDQCENETFEFIYNKEENRLSILIDGESYEVGLKRKMMNNIDVSKYTKVLINNVDIINNTFNFEFIR